jgi:hypothetical protein
MRLELPPPKCDLDPEADLQQDNSHPTQSNEKLGTTRYSKRRPAAPLGAWDDFVAAVDETLDACPEKERTSSLGKLVAFWREKLKAHVSESRA